MKKILKERIKKHPYCFGIQVIGMTYSFCAPSFDEMVFRVILTSALYLAGVFASRKEDNDCK